MPRDRYPEVWEEFERLLAGGIPLAFENPILTKSGEERYILWRNAELRQKGRVVGTLSFGIDITERRRAEQALESQNRLLAEAQLRLEGLVQERNRFIATVSHELRTPLAGVLGFAAELRDRVGAFTGAESRRVRHSHRRRVRLGQQPGPGPADRGAHRSARDHRATRRPSTSAGRR